MDMAETADQYARNEDCFTDHRGDSLDINYQLSSLQQTTFPCQSNSPEGEHELYLDPLPSPTLELKEPPDRYGLFLNRMEERCNSIESLPRMLPAWNDAYETFPLPTTFLDLDFDPELELAEHEKQIRTKREPDLTKVWLPLLPVDEAKDEGLRFPLRSYRLAQLLWYQLENEKIETDADQRYLHEIRQEAITIVKSFSITPTPVSQKLDEDLVELATVPIQSQKDRESSWDADSFVSVIDLTSESDNINLCQDDFAAPATDSHTYTNIETRSSSQKPPIDECRADWEALEDIHKQDLGVFCPSRIHNSPSSSPDHCCLGNSNVCTLQEPYNNDGGKTPLAAFSDEPPKKEPLGQDSVKLFTSKYFVGTPASETTHEVAGIPRLESRLTNEVEMLVDKRLEWGFTQKDKANERFVGKREQVAGRSFLESAKISTQERHSSEDAYNTSNLLARFMEMRGIKNNRAIGSEVGTSLTSNPMKVHTTGQQVAKMQTNSNNEDVPEQQPALAPEILAPREPGCCLISLQMGYSMIKNLEQAWPANKLIDRDYESHLRRPDPYANDKNTVSFVSHAYEVDISLTPNDGVVVTTLLQVKQKQLPGSKALTSLRQRMLNLSQQYRALIVLVSEANTSGEYMAELPRSDLAAYADFVCFASHLAADIRVYLVPGAEKTLSRWILSVMAHYSPQMKPLDDSMAFCNTKWELFFRQSGLNVRASLMLSHVLFEEFGSSGLAIFLGMTTEQQVSKYGEMLGLKEHITRAGQMWNMDNKETEHFDCAAID